MMAAILLAGRSRVLYHRNQFYTHPRHCEERSDEAIQKIKPLDCFASLAMTGLQAQPTFDDSEKPELHL